MSQEYNILTANKAGEPWSNSYGQFQGYFLDIENLDGTVMINRKVDNAAPIGITYGHLESVPNKTYKKFVIDKKPEESQEPSNSQKSYEADPNKINSIEWQSALKQATQAVHDFYELRNLSSAPAKVPTLKSYKEDIVNTAITFSAVFNNKPSQLITTAEPETEDIPPVENYEGMGDETSDDIPF